MLLLVAEKAEEGTAAIDRRRRISDDTADSNRGITKSIATMDRGMSKRMLRGRARAASSKAHEEPRNLESSKSSVECREQASLFCGRDVKHIGSPREHRTESNDSIEVRRRRTQSIVHISSKRRFCNKLTMTSTDEVDQAPAIQHAERTESTGRVSSKHAFLLKDSPQDLIDAASIKPQGRSYSKEIAETHPGSIRIEEVVQGMKYAALAITDDKEDTLRKVGKSNPWHIDALKIITGSEEEAHKPLTHILSTHTDLAVDTIIDVSGVTPGGHPLDTQGYIAHNDEVIVLAFRCTTSFKD